MEDSNLSPSYMSVVMRTRILSLKRRGTSVLGIYQEPIGHGVMPWGKQPTPCLANGMEIGYHPSCFHANLFSGADTIEMQWIKKPLA